MSLWSEDAVGRARDRRHHIDRLLVEFLVGHFEIDTRSIFDLQVFDAQSSRRRGQTLTLSQLIRHIFLCTQPCWFRWTVTSPSDRVLTKCRCPHDPCEIEEKKNREGVCGPNTVGGVVHPSDSTETTIYRWLYLWTRSEVGFDGYLWDRRRRRIKDPAGCLPSSLVSCHIFISHKMLDFFSPFLKKKRNQKWEDLKIPFKR